PWRRELLVHQVAFLDSASMEESRSAWFGFPSFLEIDVLLSQSGRGLPNLTTVSSSTDNVTHDELDCRRHLELAGGEVMDLDWFSRTTVLSSDDNATHDELDSPTFEPGWWLRVGYGLTVLSSTDNATHDELDFPTIRGIGVEDMV
ncbi:hypothetical protein B0A49_13176, partial [Cryomyces minteri]